MRWPESFRPHRDAASVGGWLFLLLVVGKLLWRGAKAIDMASTFVDIGPTLANWLLSPWATIAVLFMGLGLVAYSNRHHGGSVLRPEPRGERAKQQKVDKGLAQEYRYLVNGDSPLNLIVMGRDLAEGRGIAWQGVREAGDPHLIFHIMVINASFRRVFLDDVANIGQIRFIDQNLVGPLSVSARLIPQQRSRDNRNYADRGDAFSLEIKQPLLPDIVSQIREKATQNINFSLSGLEIMMKVKSPFENETSEWPLRFTSEQWKGDYNPVVPEARYLVSR